MDNYKVKKFIKKFDIDTKEFKIVSCPNDKKPTLCEFDDNSKDMLASFEKNDCNKCRYNKKCIKEDGEAVNKVIINLKYFGYYDEIEELRNFAEKYTNLNIFDEMEKNLFEDNEILNTETNESLNYIDVLDEGIKLKRKGKFEEAKEKYLKAIRIKPKDPTAYYNLGKILYILKDYDASVRSYKIAFDLNMPYDAIFSHIGHALLDQEYKNSKYKKVIDEYCKGISVANYIPRVSIGLQSEYVSKCVAKAKEYLGL